MDKNKILEALLLQLQDEIKLLKNAALATYQDATHEESKPENKYDTRALEASYLAGAQAQRVEEVGEIILLYQNLKFQPQNKVSIGALVQVAQDKTISNFFYLSKGGGISILTEGLNIKVLTPSSALGKAIQGLSVGDTVVLTTKSVNKLYEIIKIT